jgi:hypothetical protein
MAVADLLAALETISRDHPRRVLRLRGHLPAGQASGTEPFELLIFRGFSSSVTHPTAVDPDQPLLPEESVISTAELLEAPLGGAEQLPLAGPMAVERFLERHRWT